jgi:hypothetical protein
MRLDRWRPPSSFPILPIAGSDEARRAINPGNEGPLTVTCGYLTLQVSPHNSMNRTDSQADSAGSITVTRSTVKSQVK